MISKALINYLLTSIKSLGSTDKAHVKDALLERFQCEKRLSALRKKQVFY